MSNKLNDNQREVLALVADKNSRNLAYVSRKKPTIRSLRDRGLVESRESWHKSHSWWLTEEGKQQLAEGQT